MLIGSLLTQETLASKHLDPIEVNAQSTPFVKPSHAGSYQQINRSDFANQSSNLGEVLAKQAGVHLRQVSGKGSYQSISLRGFAGHQVMVYLDGILLNDASGGAVDLSQISLHNIESIEIFHGNAPIEFGVQAQGGVIQLTSRTTESQQTEVGLGIGSFGYQQQHIIHNTNFNQWHTLVSYNQQSSANSFPFHHDNATPLNPYDDQKENRHNAQTAHQNLLIKTAYQPSPTHKLNLSLQSKFNKQHFPNQLNSEKNQANLVTEQQSLQLNYNYNQTFLATTQIKLRQKKERYLDNNSSVGLGKQDNTYLTNSQTLTQSFLMPAIQSKRFDSQIKLNANLLAENYDTDYKLPNPSKQAFQRQQISLGVALPMFITTANDREIAILPSVQQLTTKDTGDAVEDANTTDNNLRLGLKIPLLKQWLIQGSISQQKRTPSFFEKFGDRGFMVGNPDLESETALNQEVGLFFQLKTPPPPSLHWLKTLSFNLSRYYSDVENMIVQSYDARGIGRSENLNQTRILGHEIKLQLETAYGQSLSIKGNQQDSVIESSYSAYDQNRIPNFPTEQLSLTLSQNWQYWSIRYEQQYQSGAFYDRSNLLPAKTFRQHNLITQFNHPDLKVSLEALNLSDQNFESFNGYPSPGQQFYLTVTRLFN